MLTLHLYKGSNGRMHWFTEKLRGQLEPGEGTAQEPGWEYLGYVYVSIITAGLPGEEMHDALTRTD